MNPPSMTDLFKAMNEDTIWCTYCKKSKHIRDRCWKLYGKPQTLSKDRGFKGGQQGFTGGQQRNQAHDTSSQTNEKPLQERVNYGGNEHTKLNKEEIEKLKNLLGTLESPNSACFLSQSD